VQRNHDVTAFGRTIAAYKGVTTDLKSRTADLEGQVRDLQGQVSTAQTDLTAAEADLKTAQADAQRSYARALGAVKSRFTARERALNARERALDARATSLSRQEGILRQRSFGPGLYQVGKDIKPGTYHSSGGSNCYWAELRSSDTFDIISNNASAGPQTVTIDSPWFDTSGCGTWVPR